MNVCMVVYNLVNNGIGKVVLTYSAELIRHGHAVTVIVGGPCEQEKVDEAVACGVMVKQLPNKKSSTLAYFKSLGKALDEGRFDICHVHGNSGMVFPELVIAKRSRAEAVACHCHSTGCEHPVLHRVLRPLVPRFCDCMLACSDEAGKWLFGDAGFSVLPNSFELDKFRFDPKARLELRGAYGIGEDVYILGNVARLNPEKNHVFLIKIFEEFHAEHPESILLIAGGGPGEKDIRALVEASPANDSIMLLGNVKDPAKLYSAMDCFVFPSIHEGLGIVLVEAQLAGLECFVSSDVPLGARVSDRFHAISLTETAARWAGEIAATALRPHDRGKDSFHAGSLEPFDIRSSYPLLEGAYKVALGRKEGRE